jgi:hypothetical protein
MSESAVSAEDLSLSFLANAFLPPSAAKSSTSAHKLATRVRPIMVIL